MNSGISLNYNLEDLTEQVKICWNISSSGNAGLYEIERAISIIEYSCDCINSDLVQCDDMLKDGEINHNKVESIINNSRMIDVLKNAREAAEDIAVVMNAAWQSVEYLHKLRRTIEQALLDLKSRLKALLSDESTDRQKVLTLYNFNLRPMYTLTYRRSVSDYYHQENDYDNADGYSRGTDFNYSSSYSSVRSDTEMYDLSMLPNTASLQYRQVVSQNSIPENSLSDSRIRRGSSGETGVYSVRKKSNIPLHHSSGTYDNVIDGNVNVTPEIEEIAKWLPKINPGFSSTEGNSEYIPYNHNCGSCAYAVEKNLGGSNSFQVSTLYTYSDSEMEEKTGKTCRYMKREEIEEYLKSQGAGSHLIIGIDRKPALFGLVQRAGHWFNVYYDGNQIITVDGQCGKVFGWPPGYGNISRWCAMI